MWYVVHIDDKIHICVTSDMQFTIGEQILYKNKTYTIRKITHSIDANAELNGTHKHIGTSIYCY